MEHIQVATSVMLYAPRHTDDPDRQFGVLLIYYFRAHRSGMLRVLTPTDAWHRGCGAEPCES